MSTRALTIGILLSGATLFACSSAARISTGRPTSDRTPTSTGDVVNSTRDPGVDEVACGIPATVEVLTAGVKWLTVSDAKPRPDEYVDPNYRTARGSVVELAGGEQIVIPNPTDVANITGATSDSPIRIALVESKPRSYFYIGLRHIDTGVEVFGDCHGLNEILQHQVADLGLKAADLERLLTESPEQLLPTTTVPLTPEQKWVSTEWSQRQILPGETPESVLKDLSAATLYVRLPGSFVSSADHKSPTLCTRIVDVGSNSCIGLGSPGLNGPATIAIGAGHPLEVVVADASSKYTTAVPVGKGDMTAAIAAMTKDPSLVLGLDITEIEVRDGLVASMTATLGVYPPDPEAKPLLVISEIKF